MSRVIRSYAKINLFLDVTGYDATDGYHFIESVFQEISIYDTIEWQKAAEDTVKFTGLEIDGKNTVHKALKLFKEAFNIHEHFKITVTKTIPTGAGLGGGSSNAAALLKSLAGVYGIDKTSLFPIARKIGSDVSFFLEGGLCYVSGKGERVKPLKNQLENVSFVVVYPEIRISTSEAYKLITSYGNGKKIDLFFKKQRLNFDFLAKIVYNRFQNFILQNFDPLKAVKERLDKDCKAAFSFMSGSGSSLVYVFPSHEEAEKMAKRWKDKNDLKVFCCDPICGDDKFCN